MKITKDNGWKDLNAKTLNNRQVHDLVAIPRPLVAISPAQPVGEAIKTMRQRDLHHLAVVQANVLLGVISDRSIIDFVAAHEVKQLATVKVGDCMTPAGPQIRDDSSLERTLIVMHEAKVDALPVYRDGALVGIVTSNDLLKLLMQLVAQSNFRADVAGFGERVISHPLTQNVMALLAQAGI